MGLVSGLLGLPLAPVHGVVWLAGRLQDQAQEQYPAHVRAELEAVDEARRAGEISDEEAAERENDVIAPLVAGAENGGLRQPHDR